MVKPGKLRTIKLLLILAVLFSFLTRFWKLSTLPFPPEGDEIAFGYYGWSLLNFGTDEYGNKFPSSFVSIGDYKYPGLGYLNIIPAAIFGASEITVRFWSALSGVLLVILIYKICLIVTKNYTTSLASAWITAFSPWSMIESRLGWENHLAMVITLGAIYLLFESISRQKGSKLQSYRTLPFVSFILFVVATLTYAAQRMFIPLILISLLVLSYLPNSNFKTIRNKLFVFLISLGVISAILLSSTSGRGRASENMAKDLTSDETNHLQQIYVQAGTSPIRVPARVTWLLHNKYSLSLTSLAERYADHFSPNFLFFKGEAAKERIPDMGLLLYIELLLLPIGLLTFFRNKANKTENIYKIFILLWLVLAPIPSALTSGGAHINRASLMIPPLIILSASGVTELVNFFKGKWKIMVIIIIGVGFIYSAMYMLNQIFVQKPVDMPWHKEQVFKEVALDVLSVRNNYEAVVMGDDDYIYFLFYGKISPKEFISNSDIIPLSETQKWERVNKLYNIYFKMPFNCPKSGKLKTLYVCSGNEVPQNSKVVKTFYYLDNIPAFTFVEFYPLSARPKPLPLLPENVHYMVDVETNVNFPDGIIPFKNESFW